MREDRVDKGCEPDGPLMMTTTTTTTKGRLHLWDLRLQAKAAAPDLTLATS